MNKTILRKEDDLTLLDVILYGKKLLKEIRRKWYIPILLTALIGASMYVYKLRTPITYTSKLSFTVNEDSSTGGGMGSLLGQFGFGGSNSVNYDKIIDVFKSRNLIQKTLFEKIMIGDKDDFIANQIIGIYRPDKLWAKGNPDMLGFKFKGDSISTFSRNERSRLKYLWAVTINEDKAYATINIEKLTGIFSINVTTEDEQLSYKMSEILYYNLKEFYESNAVNKQKKTYDVIKIKVDSIFTQLQSKELMLAEFSEYRRDLISKVDKLKRVRLEREVSKFNIMYAKAVENLEIADFSLKNKKPFFEVLDMPMTPLKKNRMKIKTIIRNSLAGGIVLGFLYIFFSMLISDSLKKEK